MNRLLPLLVSFLFLCLSTFAKDVQVKGYTRKDGTYVAPHVRSAPNKTKNDNYSTRGNVNPNTGKVGTKPGDAAVSPTGSTVNNTQPEATDTPTKRAPVNLSRVTLGMKKEQVLVAVGTPAVQGQLKWYYPDSGWVTFKGDVVSAVEAK